MKELAAVLHRVGTLLSMVTFACALLGALSAGVDPLWAMVRSGASTAVITILYVFLCRTVVPLFGAGEPAAAPTEGSEKNES